MHFREQLPQHAIKCSGGAIVRRKRPMRGGLMHAYTGLRPWPSMQDAGWVHSNRLHCMPYHGLTVALPTGYKLPSTRLRHDGLL